MSTRRTKYIALASLLVSACGGGADGGKNAVCADFTYKEDAQAAYRNGAAQLDRDKDGIACEALPNRPRGGGSPPPSPAPSPSPPPPVSSAVSLQYLSVDGLVISVSGTTADAAIDVTGAMGIIGLRGTELVNDGSASVLTISGNGVQVRSKRGPAALGVGWSGGSYVGNSSPGIVVYPVPQLLSQVSGVYSVVGKACHKSAVCMPFLGTAQISETGLVRICPEQNYSDACRNATIQQAQPVEANYRAQDAIWSLGHWGARMVADSQAGFVGFTFQDRYESQDTGLLNTTRTTLFGVRQDMISYQPLGAPSVVFDWFERVGAPASGTPPTGYSTLTADAPVKGVFSGADGSFYLRSVKGTLYTWSNAESDLRVSVERP